MSKPKIFFNPIHGSGILTLQWAPGPLGDAIDAKSGSGVGFFSKDGKLLAVQFDDVEEESDHQTLVFGRMKIEVTVVKSKVAFKCH